jgi:hypothetical protein
MAKAKRLANGFTPAFAKDWDRACRFAAKYVEDKYGKPWHDDSISREYMTARNAYMAGYRAGKKLTASRVRLDTARANLGRTRK